MEKSWSHDPTLRTTIVRVSYGICGIMAIAEFCCYLVYFHYVFRHDNSVAAAVISKSALSSRNRSNAISMAGQVITWLSEIWFLVFLGLLSIVLKGSMLREVGVMIKVADYFLVPFIHVMTSSPVQKFRNQKQ